MDDCFAASKQVYILHVSRKNHGRFKELLRGIKDIRALHKVWGPTAFTVQVPEFEEGEEKKRKYLQMLSVHCSIQMSSGSAIIPGIIDLNTEYALERLPDAEGERCPTRQSVKNILVLMTIGEGVGKKNIFTCIVEGGNGTVFGYFSSVDPEIKEQIPKIRSTIAAQMYFFLIKRGCKADSIKKMFKKTFTIDQNISVSASKYSKTEGIAKVREEEGDDIIRAAELAGINTSLGLTAAQRRERRDNKEFEAT